MSGSEEPSTSKKLKIDCDKTVTKHRVQKYRKEWESMAEFKGWLAEAKGRGKFFVFFFL